MNVVVRFVSEDKKLLQKFEQRLSRYPDTVTANVYPFYRFSLETIEKCPPLALKPLYRVSPEPTREGRNDFLHFILPQDLADRCFMLLTVKAAHVNVNEVGVTMLTYLFPRFVGLVIIPELLNDFGYPVEDYREFELYARLKMLVNIKHGYAVHARVFSFFNPDMSYRDDPDLRELLQTIPPLSSEEEDPDLLVIRSAVKERPELVTDLRSWTQEEIQEDLNYEP